MTFRYSTISDYHKCGAYYEFKHVKGLSDGIEKSGDVAFGSCIHLGVQDLLEGGDGLDVFRTYWGLKRLEDLVYSRYGAEELEQLGLDLLEIFRDEHMKKFEVLKDENGALLLERKMYGKMGKHAFAGTADCIATFKGLPSLVDWKTAAYPYDRFKLIHNEQIYGYVELARQGLGMKLEQGVYGVAVKDPKNPRWQFKTAGIADEKLASVVANIAATCDQIEATKRFLKNPSACVVGKRVCPFFDKCYSSGGANANEETEGDS